MQSEITDYDRLHSLISSGSIKKVEMYDTGLYQDVLDCAFEYLTCMQSYDYHEAATMVNNSFNRDNAYNW